MNIEIPQHNWKAFCSSLTSLRGSLLDIRAQSAGNGVMADIVQAASLHAVTWDETGDRCSNILTFEFTSTTEGASTHRIVEPIRLVLRNDTDNDRYNILDISAEEGVTVVIFHPGISLLLLDEVHIHEPVAHALGA
jgi:hypothetical protein